MIRPPAPGRTGPGITQERITLPEDLCGWLNSRSRFARIGRTTYNGLVRPSGR